jgi:uncharacterized protein YggE
MQRRSAVLSFLAIIVVGSGLGLSLARAQTPEQRTGVRVIGQGQASAPPDIAVVSLGASVLRERPDVAFERAEQLIAAAIAAMRSEGVAERDITTTQLSLFQQFRPGTQENPEPVFLGWQARHSLSVKVRDFSRLGRVVAGAVAALEDAGELQGVSFTVEDNEALIERARDAALADAREKAERAAARLGFRLGSVTYVQELSAPVPTPVRAPTPAPTAVPLPPGARPPTPAQISAGELVFSVTVEVHWSIEGAQLIAGDGDSTSAEQ